MVPLYIRVQDTDDDDDNTTHSPQDKNRDMNAIDNSYMSSIVTAHAEKTDILEKVIKERNDMQFHLSSQVEILQQTLQELENDMNDNRRSANNQISSLEQSKTAVETNIEQEQTSLAVSSAEA